MDEVSPWPSRAGQLANLVDGLTSFHADNGMLPGVIDDDARWCLACQLVASERRFDLDRLKVVRPPDAMRADPTSPKFDPVRGAIYFNGIGIVDEALWLGFLAVHFGEHGKHGWRRVADVYGGLGTDRWTWARTSEDIAGFRRWLDANRQAIGGGFSNHRKYESLSGSSSRGTGAVVSRLVEITEPHRSLRRMFDEEVRLAGNNPHTIFEHLYRAIPLHRFGRLGRFDLYALFGRIGLLPATPARPYLEGATGPRKGAGLLLGDDLSLVDMEDRLVLLGESLGVGMDVMEDAICNWQKSPTQFVHFLG